MTPCDHIDPKDFLRAAFEYGRHVGWKAWRIHLHFLAHCPQCRRGVLKHFGVEDFAELDAMTSPYEELALRYQKARTRPLLDWLGTLDEAERLVCARRDPRFHTGVMAEELLERCRRRWANEPAEALEDTSLAMAIAGNLKGGDPESWLFCGLGELRGRIWAYRGNCLRILSDLRQAAEAFARAKAELENGYLYELVSAEVLALEASLLRAQLRFAEARKAIDEAIRIYGAAEQWHLEGRSFLKRAKLNAEEHDASAALADLDRAIPLLDPAEEPRLEFVTANIRLEMLCASGAFAKAEVPVAETHRLAAKYGGTADRLRVRWCEARIAVARRHEQAQRIYLEVRQGFIEEGIGYDAALVTLELSALYAEQGKTAEVRRLAAEMIPLFESRDIHAHALAALMLFEESALQEAAGEQLIRELIAYLKAARTNPSLRFEPPAQ